MTHDKQSKIFQYYLDGCIDKSDAEGQGNMSIIRSGNMIWFETKY